MKKLLVIGVIIAAGALAGCKDGQMPPVNAPCLATCAVQAAACAMGCGADVADVEGGERP